MTDMIALSLALAVALSGVPKAAPKKTQLKIEVKPATAVVYVDGKRIGTGSKPHILTVEPGNHTIKIVHNRDEHQEILVVKKGETTKWSWAFEDDRPQNRAQPNEAEPEKSEAPKPEKGEPPKEDTEARPK